MERKMSEMEEELKVNSENYSFFTFPMQYYNYIQITEYNQKHIIRTPSVNRRLLISYTFCFYDSLSITHCACFRSNCGNKCANL